MSTLFPSNLDTNPGDPTPNETLLAGGHAGLHSFAQDAIVAIETYIGIIGSAVTSTLTYLLTSTSSIDPGHKHTFGSINGTVSPTRGGTGLTTATKGDLIVGNGANSFANLPVGSDNTFLVADSTQPDGVKWTSSNPNVAQAKYGGTGSDGALTVTSGTTNIDCAGARFLVKNYTSISITGTGKVVFINPHANGTVIILKSQGAITLTSSATAPILDASGMGAAGGAAVSGTGSVANSTPGNTGTSGTGLSLLSSNGGAPSTGTAIGNGGAQTSTVTVQSFLWNTLLASYKYGFFLWTGAGGGSGGFHNNSGTYNLTGGVGGRGGGCLILECAGAWNFTVTNGISVAGIQGTSGTLTSGTNALVDAGAGGAAGMFIATYNILTANTGSVNVSGGASQGGIINGSNPGFGAGGGGNPISAGSNGQTFGSGPGTSGAGANGASLVVQNTEYS